MKRDLPARLCYVLLVACVPASMLCAVWLPRSVQAFLSRMAPGLASFVVSITPHYPSWSQYFCVQTLAALIAVCAALYWVSGGEIRLTRRVLTWRHVFPALVGGYALWAALSYLWSAWPYATRSYVIRELPFYFLCLVAMLTCAKEQRWLALARVFVIAAFIQAVLQTCVIWDTASADAELRAMFLRGSLSSTYGLLAVGAGALLLCLCSAGAMLRSKEARRASSARLFLAAACLTALTLAVVIAGIVRAYGRPLRVAFKKQATFYSNPNFSSAILLTGSLVAVGFLLHACLRLMRARCAGDDGPGSSDVRSAFVVVASVVAVALFAFVLLAARSLAGAVAAAVAGVAYVICILPVRKKHLIASALVAVGVAAVLLVLGSEGLRRQAFRRALDPRSTAHLRVIDWLAAGELFAHRPLTGWGMGTWPATYSRFKAPLAAKLPFTRDVRPTHPHNEFVRVVTDLGTVGLVLYVGILAFAFSVSYIGLRDKPLKLRLIGYAIWAGVLAFTAQGMFGKAPMDWSFSTNYWVLVGVLASASHWLGRAEASEPRQDKVGIAPTGWLILCIVVVATGWAWWTWAVGAYKSTLHLKTAYSHQRQMHLRVRGRAHFSQFKSESAKARPRCLWPDVMLYHDYLTGWFLKSHREWTRAARQLEQLQETAPELLNTRLFLAECYLHMDRQTEAVAHLTEFLRRNPYRPEAYSLLAAISPDAATDALERHVVSRLTRKEDQVVEDYPTAEEVRLLLNFYVTTDQWQRARVFVKKSRDFYATAQVRHKVDVYRQLRRLAKSYRTRGQQQLAGDVEAAFPEAFREGANA